MASSSSNTSKRSTKHDGAEPADHTSGNGSYSFTVKDVTSGKRLKKDDSGINVIQESDCSCSDASSDCSCSDATNDVKKPSKTNSDESDAGYSGNLGLGTVPDSEQTAGESSDPPNTDSTLIRCHPMTINSSDDCSEDEKEVTPKEKEEEVKNYDPTPDTPLPKHSWIAPKVVSSRQYGYSSKYSPDLFRYNCYGSLHMVQRLELMYKMKKHYGCVNALNFNATGTKLVSGSDDLNVIMWDWIISQPILEYRSGHGTNVFQAKFVPLTNDCYIVTCARDGQVRLGELSSAGTCKGTRKLGQHKGSAHKLALQMDSPHTFVTCGEDAAVLGIDLRKEKPEKLLVCKHKARKVPLYSIFINPQKSFEFAVGGRSQCVKVYDTRYLNQNDGFLQEYCPEHLVTDDHLNVTSLAYNYNGQEILASYNDDDIYLFDTQETEKYQFKHRYKGHRNNQTVKGVNYFGPKSEYIISGSDCGNIFFWEKKTQHIVQYMYGDEGGAVNCLEPHPTMPVLATSGLDDDIKIWVPSCEEPPDLSGLKNHTIRNMSEREEDRNRNYHDNFVDQTIWLLMQHLSRARHMHFPGASDHDDSSTASSDEMDDSGASVTQCSQS